MKHRKFFAAILTGILLASSAATTAATEYRLERIRNAQPTYPRTALRKELEGWVDLRITVAPDGEISDIEVIDAQPRRVFERAALRAANRWEFAPPQDSGINDAQAGVYRITFALN